MEEAKRRRAKQPPVRVLRVVGTSKKSVFEAIDNAVESVGVHGEKVHAVDVVSLSAIPNKSATHNPGYINGVQVVVDVTVQSP